jgi:hypothetical protein
VRTVWRIDQGKPQPLAGEIAARVINNERSQHGESVLASPSLVDDILSGRRGGRRSHKGPGGRTLLQLRHVAPMPETPPVATAQARAVAPLWVSGIDVVARSRLLTVSVDALLVGVASLLSGAQISVVVVRGCTSAAAYNHPMNALAMRKTLGL